MTTNLKAAILQPFGGFLQKRSCAKGSGFTLIEVIISLGILMTLVIAVSLMMRAAFDVKLGLSQRARVMHRLAVAMDRIADDFQHTFYVTPRDQARFGRRETKAVLRIEKNSSGDKVYLTTRTHRPMMAHSNEGDLTLVVYELKDSKTATGRKDLYRGSTGHPPSDLSEDPAMRILARDIKMLTVEPWVGDKWSQDYWDTERGESRNKLPRMVKITIEAYAEDREDGDGQDDRVDQAAEKLVTVVHIPNALEYEELKDQLNSIKWSSL